MGRSALLVRVPMTVFLARRSAAGRRGDIDEYVWVHDSLSAHLKSVSRPPSGLCCVDGSRGACSPAPLRYAAQITCASSSNAAARVSPGRASTPSGTVAVFGDTLG